MGLIVTCDKCGNTMQDVRATRTNAKGPDFKCQTVGCKFQRNRATGEWEPSDYKTAKWMTDVAEDSTSGSTDAPQANMGGSSPKNDMPSTVHTSRTFHAEPKKDDSEMWRKKGEQMNRSNLAAHVGAAMIAKLGHIDWTQLDALEKWTLGQKPNESQDIADSIPF